MKFVKQIKFIKKSITEPITFRRNYFQSNKQFMTKWRWNKYSKCPNIKQRNFLFIPSCLLRFFVLIVIDNQSREGRSRKVWIESTRSLQNRPLIFDLFVVYKMILPFSLSSPTLCRPQKPNLQQRERRTKKWKDGERQKVIYGWVVVCAKDKRKKKLESLISFAKFLMLIWIYFVTAACLRFLRFLCTMR